jgi:uncharacterized protein with FMN-binding domain
MKKGRRILLIAGAVVVLLIGMMAILAFSGMGYVRKLVVNPVNLSRIADGTHEGRFARGRFSYTVEVSVQDHRIAAVKLMGPQQAQDTLIREVLDSIVRNQSVTVDTVSGASLTTKAVSKAVENALIPAP